MCHHTKLIFVFLVEMGFHYVGRDGQHGETLSTKHTKISWVWWCASVILGTQEAEAGEMLDPRRWRLQ